MRTDVPNLGVSVDVTCQVCDGYGAIAAAQSKCRYCDGKGTYEAVVVKYDGGPVFDQLTEGYAKLDDWVAAHYRAGTIHPTVSPGEVRFVHPCRVGQPPMPFDADRLMDDMSLNWSTEANDFEPTDEIEEAVAVFLAAVKAELDLQPDMWFPIDDQVVAWQFKATPPPTDG